VELEKQSLNLNSAHQLESEDKIRPCCEATIHLHAKNNAMMVCGTCKHIIKCFLEPVAYKNYVKFCTSRHRKVLTGVIDAYHIVVFRAYEGFRS
jgi:hypothetical protein